MSTAHRPATAPPSDLSVRQMVLQRHRRRRTALVSATALLVVLVAALIGAGVVRAGAREPDPPSVVPSTTTADHTGFAVSAGAGRVDLYVDYLCPACRQAEAALAPELEALGKSGTTRVVYHPVAFLDDNSRPRGYSTQAAAAVACASQAGRFAAYSTLLFARQPAENGPGLTTEQLIALGRTAGITATRSGPFERCVRAATFTPWVAYATDVAAARKVTVTPTVLVAGHRVDVTGPDPGAALARAVAKAR